MTGNKNKENRHKAVTMGLGLLRCCVISMNIVCLLILWDGVAVADTRGNPETAVRQVEDQESRIRTRAHEYWGYKIKKDFEKSYLYESPEYRQKVKLVDYIRSFGPSVVWLDAKVGRVEVAGDQATVWVKVNYKWTMIPSKKAMTGTSEEKWEQMNKTWFHVKKKKSPLKGKTTDLQKQLEDSKGGEGGDSD